MPPLVLEFKGDNIYYELNEMLSAVKYCLAKRERVIIIVSAHSTIPQFYDIVNAFDVNNEYKDQEYDKMFQKGIQQINAIAQSYTSVYNSMGMPQNNLHPKILKFRKAFVNLRHLIISRSDPKFIAQEQIKIMNFGELLMSVALFDFLGKHNLNIQWLGANKFIKNKGTLDDLDTTTFMMKGKCVFDKETFDSLTQNRYTDSANGDFNKVLITQNNVGSVDCSLLSVLLRNKTNKIAYISSLYETDAQEQKIAAMAQTAGHTIVQNPIQKLSYVACRNDGATVEMMREMLCDVPH